MRRYEEVAFVRTRPLGTDGPPVSVIGLGCNNFGMTIDQGAATDVVGAALDAGITHFDTAETYGGGRSEEMLGKALGRRRSEAFIATKAARRPDDEPWTPGALSRRIREGCEISLRRLGTDAIDLYYEHHRDPQAPVDEVLQAFDDLVRSGKVRHVGCSNWSAADIHTGQAVAADHDWPWCRASQLHWSLLARHEETTTVPAAAAAGLGVVPYFPLASGLLTGKYRAGQPFPSGSRLERMPRFAAVATEANLAAVQRLAAFAEERGHRLVELALAWLLGHGDVSSVIAGATTADQVRANAAGADWVLTAAEVAQVAALAPTVGP